MLYFIRFEPLEDDEREGDPAELIIGPFKAVSIQHNTLFCDDIIEAGTVSFESDGAWCDERTGGEWSGFTVVAER